MRHQKRHFVYKTYNISPISLLILIPLLVAAIFFALPLLLIAISLAIILGGYLIWRTNKVFRKMEEDILEQMSKEYKYEDPDVIDITVEDVTDEPVHNSGPFLPGPPSK